MKLIYFLSVLCIINALPKNIQSKGKDTKQAQVVVAVKQENTMNKNIITSPTTNKNLITTQLPKVAEKQDNQDKQAMVKVPLEFANAFIPMVKYFSNFFEPKHTNMEKPKIKNTDQVAKAECVPTCYAMGTGTQAANCIHVCFNGAGAGLGVCILAPPCIISDCASLEWSES